MRYAILSDIHGNLEALEAVIKNCQDEKVQKILCAGDIVGYGANPNECLERLQDLHIDSVAGNHDWAVLGNTDISCFNELAKEAVHWTRNHISKENFEYLKELELVFQNEDFVLVHGTLNKPEQFIYLSDMMQALDTFYLMQRPVCFIGHSHVPQIMIQQDENIIYAQELTRTVDKNNKYIVNVGSVGQPRDGTPQAAYCEYDTLKKKIKIKRVPYDVKSTQKKILEAGLPENLAYRLSIGQ